MVDCRHVSRDDEEKRLREEYGEGMIENRGHHLVVIKDAFTIDTTIFTGDAESTLIFENYEGAWHIRHDYAKSVGRVFATGSYNGFSNTEDVIKYLRKLKKGLVKKRERETARLDRLENKLTDALGKLKL